MSAQSHRIIDLERGPEAVGPASAHRVENAAQAEQVGSLIDRLAERRSVAMYIGVPERMPDCVMLTSLAVPARPKSVILTV